MHKKRKIKISIECLLREKKTRNKQEWGGRGEFQGILSLLLDSLCNLLSLHQEEKGLSSYTSIS